eukprot:gene20194-22170_t
MARSAVFRALRRLFKPKPDPRSVTESFPKRQTDKFSWIEKLNSQATLRYIKSENRYTNISLLHTRFFQREIGNYIKHLSSLVQKGNTRVSECIGKYEYFSKTSDAGLPVVYRRLLGSGSDEGQHTVVLDHSELAKGTGSVSMQRLKISSSQKLFAAIFATTGMSLSDCNIYKIEENGPMLIRELKNVSNAEWCSDDDNLILSTYNNTGAVNSVHRYSLIRNNFENIFTEHDNRFNVEISKSRDGRYILIHSHSKTSSEVHALRTESSSIHPFCIKQRHDKGMYFIDHMNNHFYALQNCNEDEELKIARMSSISHDKQWEEIYPLNQSEQRVVQDMELFSDVCVVYELCNLKPQLTTFNLDAPDKVANTSAVVESFSNQEPSNSTLKYSVTSPTQPLSIFEFNKQTKTSKELFRSVDSWDASNYNFELLLATSKDGTNVPVSIFYSKSIKDISQAPMLVTVYGSYGVPVDLQFTYKRAFLLSKGWILAFPHTSMMAHDSINYVLIRGPIKGGGELGQKWYRSATRLNKNRTFEDLEASLLELHKRSFSSPGKTALQGSSAGGLAVAALCNTAPELIKAAILKVPFVNVFDSMLNELSFLTSQEYDEWGDIRRNVKERRHIRSYCPYENLQYNKVHMHIKLSQV